MILQAQTYLALFVYNVLAQIPQEIEVNGELNDAQDNMVVIVISAIFVLLLVVVIIWRGRKKGS